MTTYGKLLTQEEKIQVAYPELTIKSDGLVEPAIFPFKDFLFKDLQFEASTTPSVDFSVNHNVVLMQFCVDGQCVCKSNEGKTTVSFNDGQCNIVYLPKGDYRITTSLTAVNMLSIYLSEEFFFRYIQEDHEVFTNRNTNLFSALLPGNLSITHRLKNVLNEISNCEFDGHLKTLYHKAKLIELIILQLAQYEEEKEVTLKPEDVEKMTMVKGLIESNIEEVYSLSYLARIAGTNEQYLKKHFKLLFGHTVFGYQLACKMEKAKELLSTGKHAITEVSATVGYKHATHFTNAFKKFYGYVPSLVKRKLMFGSCFCFQLELNIFQSLMIV